MVLKHYEGWFVIELKLSLCLYQLDEPYDVEISLSCINASIQLWQFSYF
jgi:hypothetical protein